MTVRDRAREVALTLPEAWEDFPWEEDCVVKVRKKIFVFLGGGSDSPIGVKLTESLEEALTFDAVTPSRYGLGKYGWVSVTTDGSVPGELILEWVLESYRNVAPKTLSARLVDTA